jgi:hypothetical protein
MGHGRKTRRVLERGGRGLAQQLNETLGGWPGVRITPMFGRWGYFIGDDLFACFPVREKDHDLWIRLAREEQAQALTDARDLPHRLFDPRGWIENELESHDDVSRAVRWLRRANRATVRRQGGTVGDERAATPGSSAGQGRGGRRPRCARS